MNSRAYRVIITETARDADASRDVVTTGIEILEDGSLYLPMVLGATIVRENEWTSVTITRSTDALAEGAEPSGGDGG